MSWGAGLAGFANGLVGGMALGNNIKRVQDEYKLQKVREQGIAEAQAMQASAAPQVVDNGDMQNLTSRPQQSVDTNAAQQPQPGSVALGLLQQNQAAGLPMTAPTEHPIADLSGTPQASRAPAQQPFESASPMASGIQLAQPKRFDVGGKQFDDKKAADAYAKSQAPAIEEFYATTLVPRMTEALISQGHPDQAAAWQKYADDDKTRRNMKTWGEAFQFAQLGDFNQSAQRLMKLHPDFDDGYELVSAKPTKGPDGSDGFTMKLRDEDGNEQEVFHDARTITEVGLSQLSPIEMFNKRFQRQTQVDTLAAREAIDARNDRRTADRQAQGIGQRNDAAADRQEKKIEADRDRDAARNDARTEQIRLQAQLRAENDAKKVKDTGGYRKDASPSEQRRIVWQTLSKDPLFTTASQEEQEERINSALQFIGGSEAPAATPAATTPNPFGGNASPAPNRGVPVFRNGKIEYLNR